MQFADVKGRTVRRTAFGFYGVRRHRQFVLVPLICKDEREKMSEAGYSGW